MYFRVYTVYEHVEEKLMFGLKCERFICWMLLKAKRRLFCVYIFKMLFVAEMGKNKKRKSKYKCKNKKRKFQSHWLIYTLECSSGSHNNKKYRFFNNNKKKIDRKSTFMHFIVQRAGKIFKKEQKN